MAEGKRSRKLARELAFQALYSIEMREGDVEEILSDTLERNPLATSSEKFFRGLVEGVTTEQMSLDSMIVPCLASNWGIDRLALTDLTALRLAAYELEFLPGVPPKVSINEAVDLAVRYGSAPSGRFVNGVLGTLLRNSAKAQWDPANEEVHEPEDEYVPEEVEERVEVTEGSPEAEELEKAAPWVLRKDDN